MATNTKRCCTCKHPKPLKEFYRLRSSEDGRFPNCISCYTKQREPQKERIKETRREWERRVRIEAIKRYGRKCGCCGEPAFEFLLVVPRDQRTTKLPLPYWLKRNGFPKGYRVLCQNCNHAIRVYGLCPHQEASL